MIRIVALALVLTVLPFITPAQKKQISLKDIWASGTFSMEYVHGLRSMKDGLHYTTLGNNDSGQVINQFSYKSGKLIKSILQSKDLAPGDKQAPKIHGYGFSPDETKIMIATEMKSIYRHSTKAHYFVYDLKSKKLTKLTDGDKQRLVDFAPSGNKVAFVKSNNLYIKDLSSGKEIAVTGDGKWNHIINGGTDWVYEEEFAFDQAFFWSPDGKHIAYYRFDESAVKQFTMDMYGSLYPERYSFKYPKAGEENAKVSLYFYNVETGEKTKIGLGEYEYIPRIKWANAGQLSVITMNRHQNDLKLYLADAATGKAEVVLNEKSSTYIDIDDDLTFLPGKKGFIWTSDKGGYKHIYKYSLNGKKETQLTSGAWQVDKFLGYDEDTKTLFYTSTEISSMERHLYSIDINGKNKTRLTEMSGSNDAKFSKGFQYFINYHSGPGKPFTITLHNAEGKLIRTLKDNEKLRSTLDEYAISKQEFTKLGIGNDLELNTWMIKPPDFDESKKYPVLMFAYGGPGSQTVKKSWGGKNYLWFQMLAQQGYIVVSVDNRGTGGRGAAFQKVTYEELGKYETQDQIAAARKLGGLPYVDASRIGIWGWSYGGYMSSLCLSKGAEVFKMAIAVAPVTNWRFYDTIYTERYMKTPQENPGGYDDNSPINHVDKMEGAYLLVHGAADDNVHLQNSMEMIDALVEADKQFDFMVYPNKNHGIYGGNTRYHLYKKLTGFIGENL